MESVEIGMWIKNIVLFFYVWIWICGYMDLFYPSFLTPFDPFIAFFRSVCLCLCFWVCGFMPSPAWFRAVFVRAVGNTGYGM